MRDAQGATDRIRTGLAETTARFRAAADRSRQPAGAGRLATRRRRARGLGRLVLALAQIVLALGLIVASAGLDGFLHRGVVYGVPASAPGGAGPLLGMNVFLEKEADREKVLTTIRMLRDARIPFVRQTFSWAEIEPAPGQHVDPNNGVNTWDKYDFIVEQLRAAGIGILARVDTIPRWARPPDADVARWEKGPPQDFNTYADFVATLAARYQGRISHFQVWNEPNLTGEWGGAPISAEQYGLLLKYTYPKVKAAVPSALIVTAGLAQTVEDGTRTNNLSELRFIQGLYDSGAAPYFDILSVMGYGLGDSPEDRRVGPARTNFSRVLLAREIMERNGDGAKPIWISEYGWVAPPADWPGPQRTDFGLSVNEQTQARYTVEGLERARREWPWLGAVFVWAFRWVEPPEERPDDPTRHFAVVEHDFTPRPVYAALREWADRQAVAAGGPVGVGDARLEWGGPWRPQVLAGREYRVAGVPDATARLAFSGTAIRLRARTGPRAGRVYVAVDGRPAPGLPADEGGSYVSLRADVGGADEALPLASDLADGDHLLELRAGGVDTGAGGGEVALAGLAVGRRQPFAWAAPTLFLTGLGGLFAGLLLAGRVAADAFGWSAVTPARGSGRGRMHRRRLAWWDTRE